MGSSLVIRWVCLCFGGNADITSQGNSVLIVLVYREQPQELHTMLDGSNSHLLHSKLEGLMSRWGKVLEPTETL